MSIAGMSTTLSTAATGTKIRKRRVSRRWPHRRISMRDHAPLIEAKSHFSRMVALLIV
jgi:hypothetical protein